MKNRIKLDTMSDISEFVKIVSNCSGRIVIESSDDFRINAKSILGVIASLEFGDLWIVSEQDIYQKIEKFIIIE